MNNIIEPITHFYTIVSQCFEGINYSVPEWPGYTHVGKPVVITRVIIRHRVDKDRISDPEVLIASRTVKKDGTLSAQEMDNQYGLSSYGKTKALRDEVIAEFGSDVRTEAERIWKKLYS